MWRELNPEILLLTRQSRGLTQERVAAELGVTKGMISKWENGVASPSPAQVEQLAMVTGYPPTLFYRPEHVRGSDSVCVHHRKRASMPARLLGKAEASMHLAQLQVRTLLNEVEIEAPYSLVTLDPDEHGGPQGVAQKLRAFWGLPSGPITHLIRTVESAGGVVLLRDFGTRKLDGMSAWAKGTPPLFFLNSAMPTDRMRWTLAHELGHLVMHAAPPEDDPEEQANRFALEFLAPEAEIKHDLRRLTFRRLPMLKAYWRISMIALVKGADTLNALPPQKIKSLYVQISRQGWRREEPYPLPPETPTMAYAAARVHLTDHAYRREDLARVVGLNEDEFTTFYCDDPESDGRGRLQVVR